MNTIQREKVGRDWIADLERQFEAEFPEEKPAQRAVENGATDRKQAARPGRST